jgi:hypothetical protein
MIPLMVMSSVADEMPERPWSAGCGWQQPPRDRPEQDTEQEKH